MSFNVAVEWNEGGVSLGSATLPQAGPLSVGELKAQLQSEFKIEPERQVLSAPDGRALDDGETLAAAAALVLKEAEEPQEIRCRWDEQGVALGTTAVPVGAEGIAAAALKPALETAFQVPAACQHLRMVSGEPIEDEQLLPPGTELVMCEQFSLTAEIMEFEQHVDTVTVSVSGSLTVLELKRRLGEVCGLPAQQLRLRSDSGITLHDKEVLSKSGVVRCTDKLKFVLRVRWVEQEVTLDPKAARWAGTITLAETSLRCDGAQPVGPLKLRLQQAFGVAAEQQRLGTADGRLLMDSQVLTGEQEVLMRVVGEALLVAEPNAAREPAPEPEPAQAAGAPDTLDAVLSKAGLASYAPAFAEEELSLELLRQLAEEPGALPASLVELGVPEVEAEQRAAALLEVLTEPPPAAAAATAERALTVVEPVAWAGKGAEGALSALLGTVGLAHLLPTFEEEELGLPLLRKMAEEPVECALVLEELGVGAVSRDKLIQALCESGPSGQ